MPVTLLGANRSARADPPVSNVTPSAIRRHDEQPSAGQQQRPPAGRSAVGVRAAPARQRRVEGRIVGEDALLERAQLRPGFEPELIVQAPAASAIGIERVGLASPAIEREHQLSEQPLVVGVAIDEGLELGDQLAVMAEQQVGVDAVLDRGHARLVQARDLGRREGLVGEIGQRLSAPQRERIDQDARGRPRRRRRPARGAHRRPSRRTARHRPDPA